MTVEDHKLRKVIRALRKLQDHHLSTYVRTTASSNLKRRQYIHDKLHPPHAI